MSEMPEIQKNNSAKTEASGVVGQPTSVMPVLGDKNEVMEQNVAKPTMPAPAPSVAPAVSASQVSDSAESAPKISGSESAAGAGSDKSDGVEFTTQNIGAWKSKQEDPFAKQNQEIAEKKAKRAETRKKLQPYFKWGAIGLGAAAVIAVVVIVLVNVFKQPVYEGPTISGGSTEDVLDFREKLQEIYSETDDMDKVNEAVAGLLNTSEGKRYESEIKLAQAGVLYDQNRALEADQLLDEIDPNVLEKMNQVMYYRLRSAVSQKINDGKASEYFNKSYEIMSEIEQEEQERDNEE